MDTRLGCGARRLAEHEMTSNAHSPKEAANPKPAIDSIWQGLHVEDLTNNQLRLFSLP
jgi:hypothetical protein